MTNSNKVNHLYKCIYIYIYYTYYTRPVAPVYQIRRFKMVDFRLTRSPEMQPLATTPVSPCEPTSPLCSMPIAPSVFNARPNTWLPFFCKRSSLNHDWSRWAEYVGTHWFLEVHWVWSSLSVGWGLKRHYSTQKLSDGLGGLHLQRSRLQFRMERIARAPWRGILWNFDLNVWSCWIHNSRL